MVTLNRADILNDVLKILEEVKEGWEWSSGITEQTGLFKDLGFESIDAVALGSALEEHYNQTFPFAEYLTLAKERNFPDITVGDIVTFLETNRRRSPGVISVDRSST